MFYIQKQKEPPKEFLEATKNLKSYDDLKDENRCVVIDLLLREQKGLCPLCERKKERFTPTIEHFLPKSIFEHLQLDYHNLYVSCSSCNEPKGNHLIPAYIFDVRFNPFEDKLTLENGLKIDYFLDDGKVYVRVPLASSTKGKEITASVLSIK
jgi:uncharacterized protein (TIGR02646 family)